MIRSYEDLIGTADAYADSRTLICAVDLDVFTHIGPKSVSARYIARMSHSSEEGTALILNALVGMGLLGKKGSLFYNTKLARTYLDSASSKSITNFLWLAGQHWEDWMGLTRAIRVGRSPKRTKTEDDPVFRRRFAKALHERSFYLIPKLIRRLHLGKAKSMLDLGGGAGSYAFALLRKTPGLTATIFDRPAAVRVARLEARKAGLLARVKTIGGDLFKDDYGGPYDVIFYSNVIHIYGPKENLKILRKAQKSLRPGGRLIIVEYFLDRDQAHPADVSSFALMMFLFTESGRCYTWEEITQWLKQIGFSRFRRIRVTEKIGVLQAVLNTRPA